MRNHWYVGRGRAGLGGDSLWRTQGHRRESDRSQRRQDASGHGGLRGQSSTKGMTPVLFPRPPSGRSAQQASTMASCANRPIDGRPLEQDMSKRHSSMFSVTALALASVLVASAQQQPPPPAPPVRPHRHRADAAGRRRRPSCRRRSSPIAGSRSVCRRAGAEHAPERRRRPGLGQNNVMTKGGNSMSVRGSAGWSPAYR